MTTKITYGELYSDMVKCFSVTKNDTEYKLGDYMRMKAKKNESREVSVGTETKNNDSNLPVVSTKRTEPGAITAFFSYVNEKLTVKQAPVRDKTIRRFPIRTTITALCSAVLMCAIMLCYGIMGMQPDTKEEMSVADQYQQIQVVDVHGAEFEDSADF